jgi:hypothetical protein
MKTETQLVPCPHVLPTIERIVYGEEKGGVFMWYVRKHIQKCNHCKHTLDALVCYQEAIQKAFDDARADGDHGVTQDDLSAILSQLE